MLDSLSIVWESTPFVDHVWTVTNRMPVRIQHRIRDAFLALRESDPEHAAILADQDSGGYLPVIVSDFDGVAELVRELNESGNHRSESP
jgi:ABC-type phosphate/phosphonate transport system substrate-binding protein